jgi:hypothetical protein
MTVWLTRTHVDGLYWGSDGRLFVREDGVERRCSRCGRWTHTVYTWSDHRVCGRHVRVSTRTRIRVLTTFACRVLSDGMADVPPARVVRRGDEVAVAGRPVRQGKYDKFTTPDRAGFILVPRGRWAWVREGV